MLGRYSGCKTTDPVGVEILLRPIRRREIRELAVHVLPDTPDARGLIEQMPVRLVVRLVWLWSTRHMIVIECEAFSVVMN